MASSPDNSPAAIPPRAGSGPGLEIAPQLESVLRNLNVNLEDELIRYRRQRHGRVPPPPPPRRAAQRQTIDLISVSASSPGGAEAKPSAAAGNLKPPPPPPNPFLNQTPAPDAPLEETVESAADAADAADIEALLDIAETTTQIEDELPEAAAGSALPIHTTDTSPDGYLESSEELLKSIADEQTEPADVPEPYSPNRKNNSLLKLAGLVLVLLAGIGVGFAVTYPAQLQRLRSQLWPAGTETPPSSDATAPEASETATATPETSSNGYSPPGPDLSTREFVELDLESLSTLELEGANGSSPLPGTSLPNNPAQSPLPAPAATPTPAGQPAPAAPAPNSPATAPEVSAATPAPGNTTGAAPAAPAATTAATGSNFYVVTSYTGDASLNQARTLVPDAFVRNFKTGARIQLAAFDNQAQAEDQIAFLTQQGAAVELVGPTNE